MLSIADKFLKEPYCSIMTAVRKANLALVGDIYLVGGAVRDLLRGEDSNDLDFVVVGGSYEQFAKTIARYFRSYAIPFKDNMRVPFNGGYIDISAPKGNSIYADLKKRDFTVNNLAATVEGVIIGDTSDLKHGIIRPVYNLAFDDDPVRILRGFRQAAALNFALSANFVDMASVKATLLSTSAEERIYDELKKLFSAKFIKIELLEMMDNIGVWKHLIGDKVDSKALFKACNMPNDSLDDIGKFALFLAVLWSNSSRQATLRNLPISNQVLKHAIALINNSACFTKVIMANDSEMQMRAVWNNKTIFNTLVPYVIIVHKLNEDTLLKYQSMYKQIESFDKSMLITGSMITELAQKIAPMLKQGKWIAKTLDECNFRLTFGLIENKYLALEYATQMIMNTV